MVAAPCKARGTGHTLARRQIYRSARLGCERPPPGTLLRLDPDPRLRMLTDVVDQKVGKYPDLGRQPGAVLIGDVHGEQRQLPIHQDRDETARRDVAFNDVERLDEDAEPCQRRAANDLAVIAVERRRDADGLRAMAFA